MSGSSQKIRLWREEPYHRLRQRPPFSALVGGCFRETLWTVWPLTFGVSGQTSRSRLFRCSQIQDERTFSADLDDRHASDLAEVCLVRWQIREISHAIAAHGFHVDRT